MDDDNRTQPPYRSGEKDTLTGFLQFQRETVIRKCQGLSDTQISSSPTVSSMSLLGMLKHLTIVERYWFQGVFLDADVDLPWSEEDPDGDWRTHETDTAESAIAAYAAECAISDQIVRDHGLDELAAWATSDDERRSLRWILVHLIEETARHCGHADILRESIDGVTGE
jgi:uncharacterized damage-inducible protein DinB